MSCLNFISACLITGLCAFINDVHCSEDLHLPPGRQESLPALRVMRDLTGAETAERHTKDTTSPEVDGIPSTGTLAHSEDMGHADDQHGNSTSGHGDDHHVGIHVASWNFDYVKQPLMICIFLIIVAVAKLGFHHAHFLESIIPESCLLIILGTVIGAILHFSGVDEEAFPKMSSALFFLFLLPPIILESSYSLHDRVFADNLGTVLVYAVIGTVLNCFIIGSFLYVFWLSGMMGSLSLTFVQCLVFSALIVAVDPVAVLAIFNEIGVNNVLYFLVFGESLLNDAVTVVLYNMMKTFNEMDSIPPKEIGLGFAAFFSVSLGGLGIGVVFGMVTALLTKYTEKVRVVEPLALFSLAYTAYLTAELFHFSGIISIIGCGLVQAQYAFHNIGHKSFTTVKYFTKMISTTCDCIIFMFLGLAMVRDHVWNAGFIISSVILCLLVRFLVVYGLTFLANQYNHLRPVNLEEQFIMAYGGLRGAVAFSLVAMLDKSKIPQASLFETTTLVIIVFTVFVQGITIKPLVSLLRISKKEVKVLSIYEEINIHVTDHVMAGIEEVIGHKGSNFIREQLDYYDNKYLKHWLQRYPQTKDDTIMELYQQIALQQHYENIAGAGEFYGSQIALYQPEIKLPFMSDEDGDTGMMGLTGNPELTDHALDQALRRKSQLGGDLPRKSLIPGMMGDTKRLSVVPLDDESHASHPGSRRSSVMDFMRSKDNVNDVKDDVTVKDIRKWVVKNPKDYHKKYDRNLTREENSDLIHHLYEKQRRTARYRRASMAAFASPFSSPPQSGAVTPRLDVVNEHGMSPAQRRRRPPLQKSMTLDTSNEPGGMPFAINRAFARTKSGRQRHLQRSNTLQDAECAAEQSPLLEEHTRAGGISPAPDLGAIVEDEEAEEGASYRASKEATTTPADSGGALPSATTSTTLSSPLSDEEAGPHLLVTSEAENSTATPTPNTRESPINNRHSPENGYIQQGLESRTDHRSQVSPESNDLDTTIRPSSNQVSDDTSDTIS